MNGVMYVKEQLGIYAHLPVLPLPSVDAPLRTLCGLDARRMERYFVHVNDQRVTHRVPLCITCRRAAG